MWPYLVCLFTWLAGLVSEGREREEAGYESPPLLFFFKLKIKCCSVNTLELKPSEDKD